MKNNFVFRFLLKCSEVGERGNLLNLYNFRLIKRISDFYKKLRFEILNYVKSSIFIKSAEELRKELYLLPLKTTGTILIIAILMNIFLIVLLNKEIGFLGWASRGLFIVIALCGIYSDLTWDEVKKTSNFLKPVNNR